MDFDVCLGGREQRGREEERGDQLRGGHKEKESEGNGMQRGKGEKGKRGLAEAGKKASLVRVFLSSWA